MEVVMKNLSSYFTGLLYVSYYAYNALALEGYLSMSHKFYGLSIIISLPIMQAEVTTNDAATAASAPSKENTHRLTEARRFATAQYDKIRRATSAQVAQVRQYTQDARAQLHTQWDSTCTKARDAHKAGEEYVKQNPTTSVLTALGVGLLLGLLLGSRR